VAIYLLVVDGTQLEAVRGSSLDVLLGSRAQQTDMVAVHALGTMGGTVVPGMPLGEVGPIHWPRSFGEVVAADHAALSFAVHELRHARQEGSAHVSVLAYVDPVHHLSQLLAAVRAIPDATVVPLPPLFRQGSVVHGVAEDESPLLPPAEPSFFEVVDLWRVGFPLFDSVSTAFMYLGTLL
jgi:hypothetical protein